MQEILRLENLQKNYGATKALQGVDLTFHQGEFVVVIGPSGAGKSTLIRCINKMVQPTAGSVVFAGQHLENLKGKALRAQRAKIGMVFQHHNLVGRVNVLKNVLYGRLGKMPAWKSLLGLYSEEDKQNACRLLAKIGLDEQIYKRADELSGGQMQRVGICRAIMQEAQLLLADEPIASLDPKSAEIVMDQLKSVTVEEGLTCIVNLHQVDFAKKYATRIVGVKNGKVVFDGPPQNLTEETIADIYRGKEEQMHLRFGQAAPAGEPVYA